MWISRKRFDALEKRIVELETFRRDTVYYRYIDVYDSEALKRAQEQAKTYAGMGYWSAIPFHGAKESISVKDVVEKILAHIGLELAYVKGEPAKIEMKKKPK